MIIESYHLLLVEDVPLLAKITEQMLKKSPGHKYSSVHKSTLAEALAALKADEFDLILLDLNLPDSAELSTLTRVLEAAPEVPVVVLTSNNSHENGYQAVKLGAQDFLVKGDFNFLNLDRAIIYGIERHRLQRTIRQLAVIDELTGLYNRRGYHALSMDIFQKVRGSEARGFMCFFDLDRFKQINDELGHQKGDEALVEFAATMRQVFRKDVLLVRMGGDEFVAMGIETEAGQAEQAQQTLQIVLSVRNGPTNTTGFSLESSSGLAFFDKSGPVTLEEVTAQADAAVYRDKLRRHGPNSRSAAGATEELR
jgi:two-component system, cell cycle response regulator